MPAVTQNNSHAYAGSQMRKEQQLENDPTSTTKNYITFGREATWSDIDGASALQVGLGVVGGQVCV
ncbi:hypothetical protein, partial [Streptococcus pneumoniae]|uniref:hypothetical protein n=1 Tax=Streptococcus pneumoniae TaxID=1313 RepID=UPI001E3A4B3C